VISWLNRLFNGVGNVLIGGLAALYPWGPLVLLSLLVAVVALIVFKFCSNQEAIKRAKGVMLARILEIRLFKDDLLGIFSAFGRIFGAVGVYLSRTLRPVIVMLIPVMLLLFQLGAWYEYAPLGEQEAFLVVVEVDKDVSTREITLEASPAFNVETPGFRVPGEKEVVWRLRVVDTGPQGWIRLEVGDNTLEQEIQLKNGTGPVNALRVREGRWAQLMNPGTEPIPGDVPVQRIEVRYASRELQVAGIDTHWVLVLLVLSLVFGLILKRPLGIEF
jgi:hypothetical protein